MMESSLNQAFDAFRIEAESLAETAKVLDREQMKKAVEALAKAERIAASGCGHSGIACRHLLTLCAVLSVLQDSFLLQRLFMEVLVV